MDAYLIVDPDSRNITIPEVESAFGVYGDNNAERKYFKAPRIVGNGIDLTECYLYVNYISASTKIGQILCDVGDAPNGTATEDEIVFSWPITRNVLDKNISGEIFFAVQAKTKTGDTVFTTRKAKGNCYESIEGTEAVAEEYADIVLQLISRMDNVEANIGEQVAAYFKENPAVTAEYLDQTLQPVKDSVSQLKENKVNKPSAADNNKIPRANNGDVEWVEVGQPTDEQTNSAVINWLNTHPEATTTVQDGSITEIKINESLLNRINQSYNPILINIKSNVNVGQTPFLDGCTYDLCGHTITIEKAIGNNLSFRNGKIVLPSEYRFTDVHGSFVLENIVIESDFWSAHNIFCDDIRITNCKFTNIAFGFPDSKQVYINNNRFICTVDNSASTVGSEEFIHINPSTPLDVCVISNNYFYGSQNDCIDCFPAGFVTKIIGNTFDECSDTIIELKSHYRDKGHPNGNTEQSVDGIIISENVFKNIKKRISNTVCINIYATDERTGIVDKDFSFYPKVTISDCIFDNSNNEKVVCIRISAEEGTVLISNCRTFAKNSQDDDDKNGTFVRGESDCTVYISNCYTVTRYFLEKGASTVGIMTARVSNCYGRYITDLVDNIYMNNTKIHRIFSKKGNMRILTNCKLTDNYTPDSDSVLIGCFVKNIFSPSVTDGINVKITNSFYTGSISSNSLIESVGNIKIV